MTEKDNAICGVCGRPYHLCKSCSDVTSFTPWRVITDTFPHYMIFLAISEYTNTKNIKNAKAQLEKCDLSDMEAFKPNIKLVIENILSDGVDNETPLFVSDKTETAESKPRAARKRKTAYDAEKNVE